jgi:fused-like protein
MVKDVVVVLQALLENLDTPKKIFACDKLLETFNFLLSSSTMSVEQELIDSLASGPFITSLLSHSQDLRMCLSTIGLMLSFSGQAGLNASINFVKSKGLLQLKTLFVWSPGTESSLTDCLGIISNVARSSADHYPVMDAELSPYDTLQILLEQSNSDDVIAKVCNTIGNMCRHNDFFYKRISRLIPGLISACSREDNGCKKFGSFAIGNTAFHSATLYPELAKAIPVLVVLLGDGDEKTRANAAGALGNLVRNSNVLIKDMVSKGAVEQLLFQITSTNSFVDSSAKIALFSLGNLAMHSASREMLTKLKCDRIAESIATKARSNRDNQTIKYCERLIQKLGNINK